MRELKLESSITSRDATSLHKYLVDIGKIVLLTTEEEVMITRKIRSGDNDALERLIKTNLRFVVSVAKKYQHRGMSMGDLINEGNLGLIKAAKKFDETKGFKFISFAVWWIRQSILLALAEQTRTIRLPLNIVCSITKINNAIGLLEQKFERLPTTEEVALEVNLKEERVTEYQQRAKLSLSLDAAMGTETYRTLHDIISDNKPATDHLFLPASRLEDINHLLRKIPKREANIIRLCFGIGIKEPLSLQEISVIYGLSKERIRQIKDSGLTKLRVINRIYNINKTINNE